MSNITRLRIRVKEVNPRILHKALELMAEHYDLELRQVSETSFTLKGAGLPSGINLSVAGNAVEIAGSQYQPLYQTIRSQVNQYYIAAQNLIALRAMGYASKVEKQGQKLVITAVR